MQFTLTTCLAALVALASAYTPADTTQPPSGNPLGHPGLGELIPAGKTYTITWTPDIGGKTNPPSALSSLSLPFPFFTTLPSIPMYGAWTNTVPPHKQTR